MATSNRSSGQFDSSGSTGQQLFYANQGDATGRQFENSEQLFNTHPLGFESALLNTNQLISGSSEQLQNINQGGSGSYNSGSDAGYHFVQPNEGFDLDFVDTKDEKYICPICLLVLREPMQTECGHRFCRVCILRWLRDSEGRCPVDNEPLQEKQLFPDNFAKREILNLKVKCPNVKEGCDSTFILKQLQRHLENCDYVSIPCPNRCSDILLRKDLDQHLNELCQKRKIPCPQCCVEVLAVEFMAHEEVCPLAMISCQFCGYSLMREQLARHVDNDCPKAVIPCEFSAVGCTENIERHEMARHTNESMQNHLRLMLHSLLSFFQFFQVDPKAILDRQSQQQLHSLPARVAPNLLSNSSLSEENVETVRNLVQGLGISGQLLQDSARTIVPSHLNHAALQRSVSQDGAAANIGNSQARPLDRTVSGQTQGGSELSYTSIPSGKGVQTAPRVPDNEFQSLKIQFASQDESLARHEHLIAEFKQRNEYLEQVNRELKTKIRHLESTITNVEGRFCNGLYIWKVTNYTKNRREAELGDNTAIHSPPFYSSCYGYKLCIRANLNGVDTARGTHLSIFIHFMQGEFDDILEWPFSGRIILTVIDQNPVCEMRHHVVETLLAKPNLAAFQRPLTARNHKGFGYMEFLPLGILDNSSYLKNDTLIIKAHVLPTG